MPGTTMAVQSEMRPQYNSIDLNENDPSFDNKLKAAWRSNTNMQSQKKKILKTNVKTSTNTSQIKADRLRTSIQTV